MEITEILQVLVNTPLSAVLLWMLMREQSAHTETRKQRDSDNREWQKFLIQMSLGGSSQQMTDDQIAKRLADL